MPLLSDGLVVPGHYFPLAYAIIVGTGLVMALLLGVRLHLSEIVKTHCHTYEYWPSISATIGDFAPERFIWRTAFVLCALFRFTTAFLTFKAFTRYEAASRVASAAVLVATASLINVELVCELLRCVTAVGWTIISSTEDNLHHSASFGVYMALGFVMQVTQVVLVGRLRGSYAAGSRSLRAKQICLLGQTAMALSVAYFYTRHKQTCAPGAYSRSTMCEWFFALFNVAFDGTQMYELIGEHVTFGAGSDPLVLRLATVPSNAVMWVSDVFLGYLTVSTSIALFQTVYFVPMVAMEFTWEVALLVGVASPILLHISRVRHFATRPVFFGAHGYVVLYGLAVLTLFSYDARRINPGTKILAVSGGAVAMWLAQFARLLYTDQEPIDGDHQRAVYALPLGFALSMIMRLLFVSLDPLYGSPLYNAFLGIVFGTWCVWVQYRRSAYGTTTVSRDGGEDGRGSSHGAVGAAYSVSPSLLGAAFGSIVALSLVMVSSPGFVARLVAVDPWPSNIVLIATFLFGLYFAPSVAPLAGAQRRPLISLLLRGSPILSVLFYGGFVALTYGTLQSNRMYEKHHAAYPTTWQSRVEDVRIADWGIEEYWGSTKIAYAGGLAVVFALGAMWPQLTESLFEFRTRHATSMILFGPSTVWYRSVELWTFVPVLLCLGIHVYIVTFPFVPGGFLLRDRMDLALILPIGAVHIFGMLTFRQSGRSAGDKVQTARLSRLCLGVLCALLLTVAVARVIGAPDNRSVAQGNKILLRDGPLINEISSQLLGFESDRTKLDEPRMTAALRQYHMTLISEREEEYKKKLIDQGQEDQLRAAEAISPVTAMIWTIHTGIDNYNTEGLERMSEKIKATKADLIGLLESDALRLHNGNRDVVEYFSYQLGYDYTDYGPTAFDSTFGCALISKFPILSSKRYVLPSPLGELACLVHAKVDLMGVETNVYVGHWGNTDHWADGILQSAFLGELVQKHPGPSVFLGYLVTKPGQEKYSMYTSESEPGKFRDTALELYKQRKWQRLANLGGYVEEVSEEDKKLALVDQQYHRPPAGADPRYFLFDETKRYSTAHPRWEYVDRYCQYILYKTGLAEDEKPEHASQLQPYHFQLVDWWRVLDIDELSDTEIQVVQLALRAGNTKESVSAVLGRGKE